MILWKGNVDHIASSSFSAHVHEAGKDPRDIRPMVEEEAIQSRQYRYNQQDTKKVVMKTRGHSSPYSYCLGSHDWQNFDGDIYTVPCLRLIEEQDITHH